ncbi:sensor histidine kinase N-terminal domain-containing protein [Neisseriaceae bacterium TC5R-5]|nr:sensor histidine kinase N-terminal domain-containing protein [Neisseriaceae bacterium TC5R-5]
MTEFFKEIKHQPKVWPASLRLRLLLSLLLPLAAMLMLDAWFTYSRALHAANTAFDRMLSTSARAIADGVTVNNGQVSVDIPYFALQMFESNAAGKVFYRVSSSSGKTLTGYADLPLPATWSNRQRLPSYGDINYQDNTLRQIVIRQSVRDLLTLRDQDIWVQVAETPELRQELARSLLWGSLLQESLLVLMVLAIVLFAISRGLRPLRHLSRELARRKENEFEQLSVAHLPSELMPLVQALNLHSERVQRLVAARRRFIDDAAHQLKTPLAVMQTQAELGLRESSLPAVQQQLRKLLDTLKSSSHGVQQLLQMSRLEPDNGQAIMLARLNLDLLVQNSALDWATLAHQQGGELGYEGVADLWVDGHAGLLQELLNNLLDNALRYRRPDGRVSINITTGRYPLPWLQVSDNGPGIAASERDQVLKRFYRLGNSTVPGSGLGLAIVKEIALRHGASLQLSDNPQGGLSVRLNFPLPVEGSLRPSACGTE